MNIRIYSYPKNNTNEYLNIFVSKIDTNEYPNIFVSKKLYEGISKYIRIKKIIRMNIRIYSYQKNYTNMIRMNLRIGNYLNMRIYLYQIFYVTF